VLCYKDIPDKSRVSQKSSIQKQGYTKIFNTKAGFQPEIVAETLVRLF